MREEQLLHSCLLTTQISESSRGQRTCTSCILSWTWGRSSSGPDSSTRFLARPGWGTGCRTCRRSERDVSKPWFSGESSDGCRIRASPAVSKPDPEEQDGSRSNGSSSWKNRRQDPECPGSSVRFWRFLFSKGGALRERISHAVVPITKE